MTPEQTKQYEEVRERLVLFLSGNPDHYNYSQVDQILSDPAIAVLDKDQALPRNKMSTASELLYAAADEARKDMLKSGFARIILKGSD